MAGQNNIFSLIFRLFVLACKLGKAAKFAMVFFVFENGRFSALFYDQSFKKNSHILKREKKDKRTNLIRQVRTTKKENKNNNLQPYIAHPI